MDSTLLQLYSERTHSELNKIDYISVKFSSGIFKIVFILRKGFMIFLNVNIVSDKVL